MIRLLGKLTFSLLLVFLILLGGWVTTAGYVFEDGWRDAIYYVRDGRPTQMIMVNLQSGETFTLCCDQPLDGLVLSEPSGAAWSPDGKRLAFNATYQDYRRLLIYDFESGKVELLDGNQPFWSHDGTKIASKHPYEIAVIDLQNGNTAYFEIPVVVNEWSDLNWSPDDTKIVFTSEEDNKPYLLDFTTGSAALISDEGVSMTPLWSPDGRQIALLNRSSGTRIHVVNWDRTARREVFSGHQAEMSPFWVQNGQLWIMTWPFPSHGPRISTLDLETQQMTHIYQPLNFQAYVMALQGEMLMIRGYREDSFFNTFLLSREILFPLPVPLYRESDPGYDVVFR